MEAALAKPKDALDRYLEMSEDERGLAYFQSRKENRLLAAVNAEQAEQIAVAAPKVEVTQIMVQYVVQCAGKPRVEMASMLHKDSV